MTKNCIGVLLLAVAVVFALPGCATIVSGTSQSITVNSTPPGAHVQIGHYSGTTPVTLVIPKGKDYPLEISHGPDKRVFPLHRSIDKTTWLNLIPPLWPGFIVDAVTGAMTHYDPDIISVDFRESPETNQAHLTGFQR